MCPIVLRALRRRPGFAAGAIAALAVGMGVTTVGFSAVNAILIKGPAGRNVPGLGGVLMDGTSNTASFADYEDVKRQVPSLSMLTASALLPLAYRTPGGTETIWSLAASRSFFALIDARPLAGRLFAAGSEHEGVSAVVSEIFWRERLGQAPLAGLTIRLNNVDVPVAGILPKDFRAAGFYDPDVWVPLDQWQALQLPAGALKDDQRPLALFGRLAAGATKSQVEAELKVLAANRNRTGAPARGRAPAFALMSDGNPEMRAVARLAYLPMGMLGAVLLVAMINVSGLLFARALDRQREISLRTSLGATRGRLIRQLLTEQFVLAVLGGAAALLVSFWSASLLRAFALPSPVPMRVDLTPDATMVAFIAGLVIAGTFLPALWPAWHATADRPLHGGFFTTVRPLGARGLIVLVQVAGATFLLAGAVLFFENVTRLGAASLGFERERAIVVAVYPAGHGYDLAGARLVVDRTLERIRALPGVSDAFVADHLPFYVGLARLIEVSVTGAACAGSDCPAIPSDRVGPRYFRALGIPLRRGHEFDGSPRDADAIVISEAMAERFWPGGDPIGAVVRLGRDGQSRPRRVVGVAANTLHRSFNERPGAYLYLPLDEEAFAEPVVIVAKTAGPPASLVRTVGDQIGLVDSRLPVLSVKSMGQYLETQLWLPNSAAEMAGVCGALAMVLAAIGLFGVMAQIVGQRTREFGVRLAIGANPRDLGALVFRESAILSLPGVAVGLAAAAALSRGVAATFSAMTGMSPSAYALVAAFQVLMIVLVCLAPARRAATINPMVALRSE
jgi:putative ABC transport system permease protein